MQHLVKCGIDPERLESRGWGEKLPMFPHSQKSKNRRVEFHIQGRASEQGLRDLVSTEAKRKRLAGDTHALAGLRSLAAGEQVFLRPAPFALVHRVSSNPFTPDDASQS